MFKRIEVGMTTYHDTARVRAIIAVGFFTGLFLGTIITYLLVS